MRNAHLLGIVMFCGQLAGVQAYEVSIGPAQPREDTQTTLTVATWCASGCAFECGGFGGWTDTTNFHVERDTAVSSHGICPTVCIPLVQEFDLGILILQR